MSASQFMHVPAGLIKGARISYVSGTSVKMSAGYGEIGGGNYWEILGADTYATTGYSFVGLTSTANGIIQYLYIDGTNSLLPSVTLTNASTAPTWSETNLGWYNGTNRCIGAVWVQADGTIAGFTCTADDTLILNSPFAVVEDTTITTNINTWTTYDCTWFTPANAAALRLSLSMWNGTYTSCLAQIQPNGGCPFGSYGPMAGANTSDWATFPRGATKSIQYRAWGSSATGTKAIWFGGFRIER